MRWRRYHNIFLLILGVVSLGLLVLRMLNVRIRLTSYELERQLNKHGGSMKHDTPLQMTPIVKTWQDRQKARKLTLSEACRNIPSLPANLTDIIDNRRGQLWPYIVDDKYRLIFGFVSKVGSTNWKSAFLVLKGKFKRVEDVPGSLAHDPSLRKLSSYNADGIRFRLRNYTKFVFVRNPLARVLSAYRDKFERTNKMFQMQYGRRIISRYRENPTKVEAQTGANVSFEEFVRFITDENITSGNMDGHWEPIHRQLLPCSVPVDFIGKLETAEEDADHIVKHAGVDHLIHLKHARRNTSDSQAVFDSYYDLLSSDYIERLNGFYHYDFKLYGYSMVRNVTGRKQILVN